MRWSNVTMGVRALAAAVCLALPSSAAADAPAVVMLSAAPDGDPTVETGREQLRQRLRRDPLFEEWLEESDRAR